jgi:hypothetical protein
MNSSLNFKLWTHFNVNFHGSNGQMFFLKKEKERSPNFYICFSKLAWNIEAW